MPQPREIGVYLSEKKVAKGDNKKLGKCGKQRLYTIT
jgi:hypothetical protein